MALRMMYLYHKDGMSLHYGPHLKSIVNSKKCVEMSFNIMSSFCSQKQHVIS